MSICLTCRRRNGCDPKWKDDEFMVSCTGYIESRTNSERVTESPEALTIFIEDIMMPCYGCNVESIKNCPHKKKSGVRFCDRKECFKWLNQESKE